MLCESINVGNNLSCNFASLAVSVFEGTPYHRHNKCKRGSINVVDELRVENSLKSDIERTRKLLLLEEESVNC